MKRVTGLGGMFFKSEDPKKLGAWYAKHLGIEQVNGSAMFLWRDAERPESVGCTVWSQFPKTTKYLRPSRKQWMINYRVENLEKLLKALKREGVTIVGTMQTFDYGKFGWILDPEGNKIELWEPIDKPLIDYQQAQKKKTSRKKK